MTASSLVPNLVQGWRSELNENPHFCCGRPYLDEFRTAVVELAAA
jgi:hypothetical protein